MVFSCNTFQNNFYNKILTALSYFFKVTFLWFLVNIEGFSKYCSAFLLVKAKKCEILNMREFYFKNRVTVSEHTGIQNSPLLCGRLN